MWAASGVEVGRVNLPTSTLTSDTLAPTRIEGAAESTVHVINVPQSALREGSNVVAVEVHQQSGSSSDLRFDMVRAL